MTTEKTEVTFRNKQLSIATKYQQVSDTWLVFLHGIGCAKECFDEAFDTDLIKHYSLLSFDFVGFGSSDKPDDFDYTIESHASVAKLVIEQFAPRKVVLVAHSMGGTIGVLLARNLDNLLSFVNVEGNLVSEDASIVSRKTAEQAEDEFVHEGFDRFLNKLKSADESAYRTWATWYGQSSRVAIYRSGQSLVEWSDSGKLLHYFHGLPRRAYVYGDQADNDFLLKQLQDTKIISIPNSGHFMMLDNPSAFYAAVAEHIKGA
jgi:pimeloyl-ACP methyl ester carboxylesterase